MMPSSKWARWRLTSPASPLFAQLLVQAQVKKKHQSSASLAFVWGIHRSQVHSRHQGTVRRKMFPFDDVIMITWYPGRWVCRFSTQIALICIISFTSFWEVKDSAILVAIVLYDVTSIWLPWISHEWKGHPINWWKLYKMCTKILVPNFAKTNFVPCFHGLKLCVVSSAYFYRITWPVICILIVA